MLTIKSLGRRSLMHHTKIVATIGPASREPEVLVRMVEAGMDVARLNFSHGNLELHAENAERVRTAASAAGRQVAILQDLPGPKLRVGAIENEVADLKPGETLVLMCRSTAVGNESPAVGQLARVGGCGRRRRRDLPC